MANCPVVVALVVVETGSDAGGGTLGAVMDEFALARTRGVGWVVVATGSVDVATSLANVGCAKLPSISFHGLAKDPGTA